MIDINISDESYLQGTNTVSFTNTSTVPLQTLLLQLPLNGDLRRDPRVDPARYDPVYPEGFEKSEIAVRAVISNGSALKYEYADNPAPLIGSVGDRNFLKVFLPEPLQPGEKYSFTIQFTSTIPKKLGNGRYQDVLYLQGMWYPSLAAFDDNGQFQQDLNHLLPATYKITVISPADVTVVTGAQLKEISRSKSQVTREGVVHNTITMLPLVASDRFERIEASWNGVTIDSYYLPGDEDSATASIAVMKEGLSFYADRFNLTLPAQHISIVDNYMGSQAAYSAGNTIFMPKELRRMPQLFARLYEVILVHEIGHMWWGLDVSYGFNQDNWIGEGFCTFFMNRYFENKYGKINNLLNTPKDSQMPNYTFEELYSYLPYRGLAVYNEDPPPALPRQQSDNLPALTLVQYQKGFYITNILYEQLGHETFVRLLEYLIAHYNKRILSTDDLLQAVNTVSGRDYTQFFDDWVYGDKKFDYEISDVKSHLTPSLNYETTVTVRNKGDMSAPLTVRLIDRKNNWHMRRTRGENTERIEFISAAPVKEVQVDPDKTYPDIHRLDNFYPSRYSFKRYINVPDSDAYYLSLQPSVYISNLGTFATVQAAYGYLDDFNFALQTDTESSFWNVSYQKNRLITPHLSFQTAYSSLQGLSAVTGQFSYFFNHTEEKVTYPGTVLSLGFQSEDLYRYVLREDYVRLYGLYTYMDLVKTSHVNKLIASFSQRFGLSELSHFVYGTDYEMNRTFLGGDLDFDQASLATDLAIRVGHLKSLSLETLTLVSKGEVPEEKYYYLFSSGALRARPRGTDVNLRDRNLSLLRTSLRLPLFPFIYDLPLLSNDLWLDSVYVSLFHEWGTVSQSASELLSTPYYRTAGVRLDFNLLSLGQFPLSINLVWARALPDKDAHKEPTHFWIGVNGQF